MTCWECVTISCKGPDVCDCWCHPIPEDDGDVFIGPEEGTNR